MEPVLLARLLCATVIAGVFSASGVASTDPDARSVSYLVRHRRFTGEENSRDKVTPPWGSECAWQYSSVDRFHCVRLQCSAISAFSCEVLFGAPSEGTKSRGAIPDRIDDD